MSNDTPRGRGGNLPPAMITFLRAANSRPYGLAAYLYTAKLKIHNFFKYFTQKGLAFLCGLGYDIEALALTRKECQKL